MTESLVMCLDVFLTHGGIIELRGKKEKNINGRWHRGNKDFKLLCLK